MNFLYPPSEYLRPWKLLTLAIGIGLLVAGSIHTPAPDWDIPVSLLMAGCTYFTAPCSLRVLLDRKWRQLPLAILSAWLSVDGGYALYWHFRDPAALALMRSANAPASLALYVACGGIWLYRGTLRELFGFIKSLRFS
ncbi:MAG: hypothetical protein QM719_10410 [Thermomonas sp.]